MNNPPENLSPHGRALLSRRSFLHLAGVTMGGLGLAQLLAAETDPSAFTGKQPVRPDIDPNNPYAPRPPHFPAAATQVLVIY